jgi:autotransporter-associated beta strand protein
MSTVLDLSGLGRLSDRLARIAHPNVTDLMLSWMKLVLDGGNRKGVLAGTDKDGLPMAPVTYRPVGPSRKLTVAERLGQNPRKGRGRYATFGSSETGFFNNLSSSAYRQLDGPPLAPRRQFSRVITNFLTAFRPASGVLDGSGRAEAIGWWDGIVDNKGRPFLAAHFDGLATGKNGRTDVGTVASAISGSGSVTIEGGGTVTLSGANTYSGGTTISAGTLQVENGGSLGSGAIADNASLVFNRSDTTTIVNSIDPSRKRQALSYCVRAAGLVGWGGCGDESPRRIARETGSWRLRALTSSIWP